MANSIPANCMDCGEHIVINDRDPDDWFCDDDVAVLCKLSPRTPPGGRYVVDTAAFRPVTVACRPYKMREECTRPKWCPLAKT